MLKSKKNVGIIYGHKRELLEYTKEKISEYEKKGYRVRCELLGSKDLRKGSSIFEEFKEKFDSLDSAIIFMTKDDVGISEKALSDILSIKLSAEELKSRLNHRARQNVVFELGYVVAKVGKGNYRIFAEKDIEIPSDIQGKYLERDLSNDNIEKIIKELIEENLGLSQRPFPIEDENYRLDYSNLAILSEDPLKSFDDEYKKLDDDGDKLIFLFERIVFDSYFQKPEWWQIKFKSLSVDGNDKKKIKYGCSLLEEIDRYMSAWRPPETRDYDMISIAADKLYELLEQINDYEPINPIFKIVAYDYLGLASHKIGTYNNLDEFERVKYLERSCMAFEKTVSLADRFDDPILPLWRGYASFNLARTFDDLNKIHKKEELEDKWKRIFAESIYTRKKWTNLDKISSSYRLFPIEIKEGLVTEYHHAKAERIKRARSEEGKLIEKSRHFNVDKDYIKETYREYQNWLTDPIQIRVRLAKNVHESWGIIKERFQKVLSDL